jgi:hypothetical protein
LPIREVHYFGRDEAVGLKLDKTIEGRGLQQLFHNDELKAHKEPRHFPSDAPPANWHANSALLLYDT